LFAIPEGCPFCYSSRYVADGATWFLISAVLVTEDRHIAAMNVVLPVNEETTVKRKEDIARQRRARNSIAKPKTVADKA